MDGGALGVKASGPSQAVGTLSGGNQQKVALARLLHQDADVFLLDEPTRGIDVGSKAEIYRLIGEQAAAGKAVLMVSSYLPELMGLCDRIAVMSRGDLERGEARRRLDRARDHGAGERDLIAGRVEIDGIAGPGFPESRGPSRRRRGRRTSPGRRSAGGLLGPGRWAGAAGALGWRRPGRSAWSWGPSRGSWRWPGS